MEQKSIGHFFVKIMYEIYNPYLNKKRGFTTPAALLVQRRAFYIFLIEMELIYLVGNLKVWTSFHLSVKSCNFISFPKDFESFNKEISG